MAAIRTEISAEQLPDSLSRLRSRIEQRVPVGFNHHGWNWKTRRT
jgi:tRNA-splicing ligase RtcB (3'-phosphate/5'-hydroxy nucleic acid ligase)